MKTIIIDYQLTHLLKITEYKIFLSDELVDWLCSQCEIWKWEWVWHFGETLGPGHGELTLSDELATLFTLTWL
jgi:hypothetical protein